MFSSRDEKQKQKKNNFLHTNLFLYMGRRLTVLKKNRPRKQKTLLRNTSGIITSHGVGEQILLTG